MGLIHVHACTCRVERVVSVLFPLLPAASGLWVEADRGVQSRGPRCVRDSSLRPAQRTGDPSGPVHDRGHVRHQERQFQGAVH